MSLHDAARAAHEKAYVSLGRRDHHMALALAAAVPPKRTGCYSG